MPQLEHSPDFIKEFSVYWMAKSLFDLREYRRAAHALRLCKSDEAFFLKCYSLYLVGGTLVISYDAVVYVNTAPLGPTCHGPKRQCYETLVVKVAFTTRLRSPTNQNFCSGVHFALCMAEPMLNYARCM